jgi:putative ABC transport system ATP-binding protein
MSDGPPGFLLFGDRLRKTYPDGRVQALRGVTLGVRAGESVSITGPSGCGKSTLLNLLGALDRPDDGEVYFQGEPLSKRRDLDRLRARQIGFVFQSFFLLPTLTGRENVQVPMLGGPLSNRDRVKRAERLLESVGLADRAGHRPAQLSVGERQRVALARALANEPVLLLADEPTGNLDSQSAEDVLGLLAALQRDHGLATVVVTHSPEVAERADRMVRMRDGQIVEERRPAPAHLRNGA